VEFVLELTKEDKRNCFDCGGRCLDEENVKCNFIDDCGNGMDEKSCPNPNNLTIVKPIEKVIVDEGGEPSGPGGNNGSGGEDGTGGNDGSGGVVIDPDKFEEYFDKCDPEVYASCRELAACLEDGQCRPTEADRIAQSEKKINAWKKNFPCGASPCSEDEDEDEDEEGIPWWVALIIALSILFLVGLILLVFFLLRRRRRRSSAGSDENENAAENAAENAGADGGEVDVDSPDSEGVFFGKDSETADTDEFPTYRSDDSLSDRIKTEFEKADNNETGWLWNS